jgi:Tol biopolymer transport system component
MVWKTSLLVVALVVDLAAPATAAFPGQNGRIAFIEASGTGLDIFTMNPDGSDVKQLTTFGSSGGFTCCATWSPDGRQLVFGAEPGPPFVSQLWIMNEDGSNQHELLNDPSAFDFTPSFSPDGSQIVFSRCNSNFHCAIYRVGANGFGLTALTPYDPNPDVNDFDPAYSPDGRTIAFTSFTRGGVIAAIYLMDANGSNIRELTPAAIEAVTPDWSSDGTKIAFWVNCCDRQTPQIWSIHANGTALTQLTNPQNAFDFTPAWSPQGDAITFERDNTSFTASAIYVITANGGGQNLALESSGSKTVVLTPRDRLIAKKRAGRGLQQSILSTGFSPRWGPASQ